MESTQFGILPSGGLSPPKGLHAVMEGLVREVLMKNPKDIFAFAAEYFETLIDIRKKANISGESEINNCVYAYQNYNNGKEEDSSEKNETLSNAIVSSEKNIDNEETKTESPLDVENIEDESNIEHEKISEKATSDDEGKTEESPEKLDEQINEMTEEEELHLENEQTSEKVKSDDEEKIEESPDKLDEQINEITEEESNVENEQISEKVKSDDEEKIEESPQKEEINEMTEETKEPEGEIDDDEKYVEIEEDDNDDDDDEVFITVTPDKEISTDIKIDQRMSIENTKDEDQLETDDAKETEVENGESEEPKVENASEEVEIADIVAQKCDDFIENESVIIAENEVKNEIIEATKTFMSQEVLESEQNNIVQRENENVEEIGNIENVEINKEENITCEQNNQEGENVEVVENTEIKEAEEETIATCEQNKNVEIEDNIENAEINKDAEEETEQPELENVEIVKNETENNENISDVDQKNEDVIEEKKMLEIETENIESNPDENNIVHEQPVSDYDKLESKIDEESPKSIDVEKTTEDIQEVNEVEKVESPGDTIVSNVLIQSILTDEQTVQDENEISDEFVKASILIQKIFRGFIVRKKMAKDLHEKRGTLQRQIEEYNNDENDMDEEQAAPIISASIEPVLHSVSEERSRSSSDEESSTFSSAATKIQATVRGYLTRKYLQQNKTNNSSDTTAPSIEDSRSLEDIMESDIKTDDAVNQIIISTSSLIAEQLEHFEQLGNRTFDSINLESLETSKDGEESTNKMRKKLRREDAIQLHSPFSSEETPTKNSPNKTSEDEEPIGDLAQSIITEIVTNSYTPEIEEDHDESNTEKVTDILDEVDNKDGSDIKTGLDKETGEDDLIQIPELSISVDDQHLIKTESVQSDDNDVIIGSVRLSRPVSSNVSEVATPRETDLSDDALNKAVNDDVGDDDKMAAVERKGLIHSSEYHDTVVLPTRIIRKTQSVAKVSD